MLSLIALLAGLALDPAFVKATVESIATTISQEYFDPKVGAEVDAALRRGLAEGRDTSAADDRALATLVNRDLFAATRDKHLNVEARLDIPAQRERSASQADEARADGTAIQQRRSRRTGPARQRRVSRPLVVLST